MIPQFESFLVDEILDILEDDNDGVENYLTEFNYGRGKPDIIILTKNHEIVSVEAKLRKWRDALHQAYRNTCFANYSYILLPKEIAQKAFKFQDEFNKRSVGIYYIEEGKLIEMYKAKKVQPIQSWLNEKATDKLLGVGNVYS